MASLLYRLGRASASRPWLVVVVWVLTVAVAGVGALTLSQPLGNSFDIPGSRFQQVTDDLRRELPEAAGGTGTVVFSSADGFDDAERQQVAELVQVWSGTDGVVSATDPFTTQDQLDSGAPELTTARAELQAGATELAEAREDLEAAQAELDEGEAQWEAGAAALEAQGDALPPEQVAAAQEQLDQGRAELDAGQAQIDAGLAEVEAGETELAAGRTRLDLGERLLALTEELRFVSSDGTVALGQVQFEAAGGSLDPEVTSAVVSAGDAIETDGLQVDFGTELTEDLSSIIGPSEAVGVAVAALVLLVMLGALLAAGLPLLVAAVGVGVGLGGALSFSSVVDMNSTTPALALMLGLAVGIDYSLFILHRHRTQLREGTPRVDSIALASGTAGTAVTFAGATVVIALAALTVTGIPFLAVMGVVAAATVVVAVLASVTLTPALLSLLGDRVLPRRQRGATPVRDGTTTARHLAERPGWVDRVQQHPWLAVLGVLLLAGVLAAPAAQLRLGLPDGSSEPVDSTAYRAYDAVGEGFGAGANGPLVAVATLEEPVADDETTLQQTQLAVAEPIATLDGVVAVAPVGVSQDRTTLVFQVVPQTGPADEATETLVNTLTDRADELGAGAGAQLGFTGQTVANIDISAQLADALPLYLVVVVGLSLVLLVLVFRSLWVPLLATAGFLVSLAVALGGIVAVYQLGYLGGVFAAGEPGPIMSFLPILVVGVLFGLAMDYQVFLVSAMREAYVHGADAREAVRTGFRHSARVVTAAAIIMISVFGGFVFAHLTLVRPIGFALALGVLVDAFLVRMTLTPAVLTLLGERAWRLPRRLDRVLPDVDVEGARLERELRGDGTGTERTPELMRS